MSKPPDSALARRERQVMDILYRLGEASAQEIHEEIPKPPSYSAVRALLATMTEKEFIKHRKQSRRYLFRPAISEVRARRSALGQLITTFFDGRPEKLVESMLDPGGQKLGKAEIEHIRKLIDDTGQ